MSRAPCTLADPLRSAASPVRAQGQEVACDEADADLDIGPVEEHEVNFYHVP